ncbi:MAG TPA: Na+/H+ antiporter NhaA [Bauldia sp.]
MFQRFIQSEAAGGIVLMASAALALIVANSPLASGYFSVLAAYAGGLSVLHWINDALMALFFLLVGLEIKRELVVGELATWPSRALPGFAALGGMIVPALIYTALNAGSGETLRGWAIPTATDIAFSLGVLALLGPRVPTSLKVFLTALAILDDLGAVVVIALFYTAGLSMFMLGLAGLVAVGLVLLNATGVRALWAYLLPGALLWFLVLKSGVHPTIAGVVLAATVPIAGGTLERLEHLLQRLVALVVLPLFGFANAGVALGAAGLAALGHPVALGAALGLFAGKQIGVFGGAWLTVRAGLAARPACAKWRQLYAVAVLCGIGFTMSLFIGLLAFNSDAFHDATKIGVLAGSLASAIVGYMLLRASIKPATLSPTR